MDLKNLTDAEIKQELIRRKKQKSGERKAYKALVQEELPNSLALLQHASRKLAEAKTEVFEHLLTLVEFKGKAYGVKSGQQSHTFSLDNGDSITMGYRVIDNYDDTVNEGIAKIKSFYETILKDESPNEKHQALIKTINILLKMDKKGNLKPSRVIELQNLASDLNYELLSDGVDIITKAYKPVKSVYFIDATIIGKDGAKENVPLSISSVPFTKELEINF
jgi:hypothetical protein